MIKCGPDTLCLGSRSFILECLPSLPKLHHSAEVLLRPCQMCSNVLYDVCKGAETAQIHRPSCDALVHIHPSHPRPPPPRIPRGFLGRSFCRMVGCRVGVHTPNSKRKTIVFLEKLDLQVLSPGKDEGH